MGRAPQIVGVAGSSPASPFFIFVNTIRHGFFFFLVYHSQKGVSAMSNLKPELSTKNDFYISKHRYYELKHFCMQYYEWKQEIRELRLNYVHSHMGLPKTSDISKPVEYSVDRISYYGSLIDMIETAAYQTDKLLAIYILKGVVEGRTYDYLKTVMNIPCCRNTYYELYREFFWNLSNIRK